jgi:hypothetical protein
VPGNKSPKQCYNLPFSALVELSEVVGDKAPDTRNFAFINLGRHRHSGFPENELGLR